MGMKIKYNSCSISLEKVGSDEFWLRFEFIEKGMIVEEPIEIDNDVKGEDEFCSNGDICNALYSIKHTKWTIDIISLNSALENPRAILLDECNKLKNRDKKIFTSLKK